MPVSAAATCSPPARRARRSAQGGWTRRSPARSLEAVAPAGIAATAAAIGEIEDQHEARMAGQRLALERAQYEADRAQRKFDACEPENRLVGRTLERALEEALANLKEGGYALVETPAAQTGTASATSATLPLPERATPQRPRRPRTDTETPAADATSARPRGIGVPEAANWTA